MFARIATGLDWLADYLRWRGWAGAPLLAWHLAFRALAPSAWRLRAPAGGGRSVWLRPRRGDLSVYRKIVVQQEFQLDRARAAAIDRRCAAARAQGRRPLILDAGGGVGLFAQAVARRWPEALVLCVEPRRKELSMARRNCAGLSNVRYLNAALWSAPGRLTQEDPDARDGAFAFRRLWAGEEENAEAMRALPRPVVEATTIDAILAERPEADLVVLKMNIAGAEAEALRPAAAFWRHRPAILIVPHDRHPGRHATLRGLLAQHDLHDADWEVRGERLFVFPREEIGAA